MGAWGVNAFDNDTANDWAYDLEDSSDLTHVLASLAEVETVGDEYLDQDPACNALAACEVIARLKGRPGYTNAYTQKVDNWVAAHPQDTPPDLVARANAVIDRIVGAASELAELWSESGEDQQWRSSVADLRARVTG